MTAKVINFFGGPGLGKSTTAMGVAYHLKLQGINVEATDEYAKSVTWDRNPTKLEDQFYITAKQNRRLWRLRDQVDWIVSDSPLLLGLHYAPPVYFPEYYKKFLFEVWNHYENINFLIERTVPYDSRGRNQTEEQAREIDASIKEMLDSEKVEYFSVPGPQYRGHTITVDAVRQYIGGMI
jgi:nicotinamide riboside kinase